MKNFSKIFNVLLAFLLVFSMMAPSLASASLYEDGKLEIAIDLNSDEREIIKAEFVLSSSNGPSIGHLSNDDSPKVVFNDVTQLFNSKSEDVSLYVLIVYKENDTYVNYVDKMQLTLSELKDFEIYTIDENMQSVKITDIESSGYTSLSVFFDGETNRYNPSFSYLHNNWVDSSDYSIRQYSVAKASNMVGNVHYLWTEENENNKVYVTNPIEFSSNINIADEYGKTVDVTLEGLATTVNLGVDAGYIWNVPNQFKITPGTYHVSYYDNQTASTLWVGEVSLNKSEVLNLPTEVSNFSIELLDVHTFSESVQLRVNVDKSSGDFRLAQEYSNQATAYVYKNGKEITSTSITLYDGTYIHLNMGKAAAGEYELVVKDVVGNTPIESNKVTFYYDSDWKPLKGTVFTFEESEGVQAKSGNLEVYDAKTGQYVSGSYPNDSGEFFIPNGLLSKGKEYLAVYTNSTSKVAYSQKFEGLIDVEFHLKAEDLEKLSVKLDGYSIDFVKAHIQNGYNTISENIYGWMYAGDAPIKLMWVGVKDDNYYTFGKTFDSLSSFDLKDYTWKTVKASNYLPNSKFFDRSIASPLYADKLYIANEAGYVPAELNLGILNENKEGLYASFNLDFGIMYFEEQISSTNVFYGNAYHSYKTRINTSYQNEYFYSPIIYGEVKLEYVLTNDKGESINLTSDALDHVDIPTDLEPGTYSLTLVNHNIDKELLDFTMHVDNLMINTTTVSSSAFPSTLKVDLENNPYMDSNITSGISLDVRIAKLDGSYVASYYNRNQDSVVSFSSSSGNLVPTDEYKVIITVKDYSNGIYIIDEQFYTGEDIANLKVLDFSADLIKNELLFPDLKTNEQGVIFWKNDTDITYSGNFSVSSYQNKYQLFMKPGNYHFSPIFNSDKALKIYGESEYVLNGNTSLEFKEGDLYPVTVEDNGNNLQIQTVPIDSRGYISFEMNQTRKTLYMPKGIYSSVYLGVVNDRPYESPWSYNLSLVDFEVNNSKTLKTNTDNIQIEKQSVTFNEISRQLYLRYGVKDDKNNYYSSISKPVLNSWNSTPHETYVETWIDDQPVRLYYQSSVSTEQVRPVVKVINSDNEVVYEASGYSLGSINTYIPEYIPNGTYTVEVILPTGPKQVAKLTDTITIGTENTEFVAISSPVHNFKTSNGTIDVAGVAYKNSSITVKAVNAKNETVQTKSVKADAEGKFSTTFTNLPEGTYSIIAVNGTKAAQVSVVIDKTPPAKVTGISVEQSSTGLNVTWNAVEDAKKYKVIVIENGVEKVASEVSGTAYTITNIVAGATYVVTIEAYDEVGNKSVSDAVAFEVPSFVVTDVKTTVSINNVGLVAIDDEIAIAVDGSYKVGFIAEATIVVDGNDSKVKLEYNAVSKKYEGKFVIAAGMKEITSISAVIIDGDHTTEAVTKELVYQVGSTISGTVTDDELIKDATVRIISDKYRFSTKTDENGAFVFKGIPAGTYSVETTVNGVTKKHTTATVNVAPSEVVNPIALTVDAYSTIEGITVSISDQSDVKKLDGLYARVSTTSGAVIAYGYIEDGKFVPYNTAALNNLKVGTYTFTVTGYGVYKTLTQTFELTKSDKTFAFVMDKVASGKSIKLNVSAINEEELESVDYVSLYSPSVYSKYNYQLGNYYLYDKELDGGSIEINDVILADDYHLYVYKDGYISKSMTVSVTGETTELSVVLDKGRTVEGSVTYNNEGVAGISVWTYTNDIYSSAVTDAEGKFVLNNVSGEVGQVYISADGYMDVDPIELEKGTEKVVLDSIVLSKGASLEGKVVDKDGEPIQYASINVYDDNNYIGWARSAIDGSFSIAGLDKDKEYQLFVYYYPYPTFEAKVKPEYTEVVMQYEGSGNFAGEGNLITASKSQVAPGEEIQYTVAYKNNGSKEAENVPVTVTLPTAAKIVDGTVMVNGKLAVMNGNVVTIPTVKEGESGNITFKVKVDANAEVPSITTKATISEEGEVLTASTSLVYLSLEAPSTTAKSTVKVYGSAQFGSLVEIYANGKLVGTTSVDSKWWFADVKLPIKEIDQEETIQLTAIAKLGDKSANAKPVAVNYTPEIPEITELTVGAGWNGNVALNPYTGVATFAITEHTNMPTTIKFNDEVDSASLVFLNKKYEMTKKSSGKEYYYNGVFGENGLWTSYGEQILAVEFTSGDVTITLPIMNIIVLIDPSGFVFEDSMDNPLEGVKAVVEVLEGGAWVPWDAERFGQVNPQITDAEGRYGWDVITGKWRVVFSKDGYKTYISRIMDVPPAEVELNVPMVKIANPTGEVAVSDNKVTVTFDRYMNVATAKATLVDAEGNEIDGELVYDAINGYKLITADESGRAIDDSGNVIGFAGQDSNEKDGFFAEDAELKIAKVFNFVPSTALEAGKEYTFKLDGGIADVSERQLGDDVVKVFTATGAASGGDDNGNGGSTPGGGDNGGSTPGGNTGGTGGGAAPAPAPQPSGSEVTVDASTISNQLSNPTVVVEAAALTADAPAVDVALSKEATALLVQNNKDLTVKVGNVDVVVPVEVLKQAGTGAIELTIGLSSASLPSTQGANAISATYTFNFTADGKAVTTFDRPIEIKIPVNGNVKKAANVAAYYVNRATNSFEFVVSKYVDGNVVFKTKHFSDYVVLEGDKTFADIQSHWAKSVIEELASKSIINGKTAVAFEPEATITRAEFAALVTRVLGLPKQTFKGTFSDVKDAKAWYAYDVEAAVAAGIVNGIGDGKFDPNAKITREQMATMIVRAIEYMNAEAISADAGVSGVKFADAGSMSAYAVKNINIASTLGIINGVEENGVRNFKPAAYAKRAEAAKMLAELLKNL